MKRKGLKLKRKISSLLNSSKTRGFLYETKWFLIWTVVYVILIWILNIFFSEFLGKFEFFNIKIVYILLIGFSLTLLSKIIYSVIFKKGLYLGNRLIYWTIAYSFLFWLFEFISNYLSFNKFIELIALSGV